MSLNPSKKDNSNSEIILELFELISKTSWYKSDFNRFSTLLKEAGSKFDVNTKDSEGNTLLNKVAKMNNVIATLSLVKVPHIDINNLNNDSETPLITASHNGYYRLFNAPSSLVGKIDLNVKDK